MINTKDEIQRDRLDSSLSAHLHKQEMLLCAVVVALLKNDCMVLRFLEKA